MHSWDSPNELFSRSVPVYGDNLVGTVCLMTRLNFDVGNDYVQFSTGGKWVLCE